MPVTRHFVMLGSFLALSLTFATVSAAQDLSANQASAPAEDRILVERDRVGNERREQAKSFIEHVEIGRSHEQAARWVDRICPKVVGVEGEIADRLVASVGSVAEAIGAPVAPKGCSANISIALVDDGAEFVDAVHLKDRRSLRGVPAHKLEFVRESDAPVRWWYTTEVFGSGGRPLQDSEPSFIQCVGDCQKGQILPAGRDPKFISSFNATRIGSFYERQIRAAQFVIDVNRAAGTNVASLADYVSLVALS
ncbi:MAG: hypothetical protein V2I43_10900, partial [Parvularcula sp.]|nr:hypothetical protein [Parvularcula sp.]